MMNNKKENKFDKNKDLEKMMKVASEGTDLDDISSEKTSSNKSSKRAVKVALASFGALVALVSLAAILLKSDQEFIDKSETPDWVNKESEQERVVVNDIKEEFTFERPIEVLSWMESPYDDSLIESEEVLKDIKNEARKYPVFYSSIAWMPSSQKLNYEGAPSPHTNDVFEEYLEDDTKNPLFSYTLLEDYERAFVIYTNRLMNPVFGGWDRAERSDIETSLHASFGDLSDMFARTYWDELTDEYSDFSSLPILADWEDNNFGEMGLAEPVDGRYGKFYGEIVLTDEKDMDVEYTPSDELEEGEVENDRLSITMPVKYSAFGEDEDIIEVHGTLNIVLGPNVDITTRPNRVVITYAKLDLNN